jgi:hypothetical protein
VSGMTVTTFATQLTRAALTTARCGQWDAASALLEAAHAGGQDDRAALALAAAEIAVAADQYRGGRRAPAALAAAAAAVAATTDPILRWELELLQLRYEYLAEIIPSDGRAPHFGPEGRDPAWVADLAARAERLATSAPTGARPGLACLFRGLIADNLTRERDSAPLWYERALADGGDDPVIAWEALRHLGDHDDEAGDLESAHARWQRSAQLCAEISFVPGLLAQQLLLADLARRTGDGGTALVLAQEIRRWSTALGLERYRRAAEAVADSVSPAAESASRP